MNQITKDTRIAPTIALTASLLALLCVLAGCNHGGKDDDDDKPGANKKQAATQPSTQPADADEGEKVKLTAAAVERYGIKVGKANKHILLPTVVAPARIAFNGDAYARVGSAVAGRVVELKAKLGDAVQKGDELLVVESTELGEAQSDLLQKRMALSAATIAVEPAKVSYERAKGLYEQSQGLSLAEVQKREADFKTAQAAEQAARGAQGAAERKLALFGMSLQAIEAMVASGQVAPRYSVRAPIAGRIVERDVTLGQFVTPDKDSLFQLADTTTFWALADVPEAKLAGVAVSSRARITLSALKGSVFTGAVTFIASSVDSATRSAAVRVELKDDGGSLKSGMFAMVEIEGSDSDAAKAKALEVVAVPEAAVQIINGQTCVFVEDDDEENAFIKRPVALGQEVNGLVPILSGLEEKEEIVKSGGFYLKAELAKSAVKDND